MIRFYCAQCGKPVEVADEYAGGQVPCPFCGQKSAMPWATSPELCLETYRRSSTRKVLLIVGAVVLGAIAVIGVLASVTTAARGQVNRAMCKSNLKNIGAGLKIYAVSNNGVFPSLYSTASTEAAMKEAWGTDLDEADGYLLPGDQERDVPGNAGRQLADVVPMQSNVHCLWMLVRDGSCNSAVFNCPSDHEKTKDSETDSPKDWWNFQCLTDCSYSYQNQLGRNTSDNVDTEAAIAADKSPRRADVADKFPPGVGRDKGDEWYKWNSPNHGYDGQNVLFGDGHVEFLDTPYCGKTGNNIWIPEKWDVTIKDPIKWKEIDGVTAADAYKSYDKGITDKDDTWLVP